MRARLGLPSDAFVCMHAGNMGFKQDLDNVVECARLAIESRPKLLFVFVGDGNQRTHLEALAEGETQAYIRHRLEAVGWQGDPAISKTIFPLIYKFSEGIPRRINLICSRLFLH